ncbi:hypothetical protein EBU71_19340, partial [bacterium]|nr:hypothetical protein [Candidatus Elulimicrobium humile]
IKKEALERVQEIRSKWPVYQWDPNFQDYVLQSIQWLDLLQNELSQLSTELPDIPQRRGSFETIEQQIQPMVNYTRGQFLGRSGSVPQHSRFLAPTSTQNQYQEAQIRLHNIQEEINQVEENINRLSALLTNNYDENTYAQYETESDKLWRLRDEESMIEKEFWGLHLHLASRDSSQCVIS